MNWDATFWWPYIMMTAPPITNRSELWGSSLDPEPGYNNHLSQVHVHASYEQVDAYYARWQASNFTVLGYFNAWELGQAMQDYPPNVTTCPPPGRDWRHAPCFIYKYFDACLCQNEQGQRDVGPQQSGWDHDTSLDPGLPRYKAYIVDQVQRHLDMLPHFMGLAHDGIRAHTNFGGDDGVSCHQTSLTSCRPIQDGFTAWAGLMDSVGPMLHLHDKLFSANTINGPRAHLLRHVDLIITEQNAGTATQVALNSWLGLSKPVVMWTTGVTGDGGGGIDGFFQRLLHAGEFPMPPMPSSDHCLRNGSSSVLQAFLDYGPLFRALKGRSWVLLPHVVDVTMLNGTWHDGANPSPQRQAGANGGSQGATEERAATSAVALVTCNASDPAQHWANTTFGPECVGAIANGVSPLCLEVQNNRFSPTSCTQGGDSNVWAYECPSTGPAASLHKLSAGLFRGNQHPRGLSACPADRNIRWRAAPAAGFAGQSLLQSAVASANGTGADWWRLCLTSSNEATRPVSLQLCSGPAGTPQQRWVLKPALTDSKGRDPTKGTGNGGGGFFILKQQPVHPRGAAREGADLGPLPSVCVSSSPPEPPVVPPQANLFRLRNGSLVATVTSPGGYSAQRTLLARLSVRGALDLDQDDGSDSAAPVKAPMKAAILWPGAPSFVPLSTCHFAGADANCTLPLRRGAAMVMFGTGV